MGPYRIRPRSRPAQDATHWARYGSVARRLAGSCDIAVEQPGDERVDVRLRNKCSCTDFHAAQGAVVD